MLKSAIFTKNRQNKINPTELTGKLISGQVETRKLWNAWLGNNKT